MPRVSSRCTVLLCVCAAFVATFPLGGAPITPLSEKRGLPAYGSISFSVELKEQEATTVVVNDENIRHTGLYVFDEHGNCIAWDDYGSGEVKGDGAVRFIPPSDGRYTIEVHSFSSGQNRVKVSVH